MTNHSTVQKQTISSHTMLPGSSVRRCAAVTVQAHQPTSTATGSSTAQCRSVSQRSSTTKLSQAHSVPTVPGAAGLSPLPKPSASQCAGWARMKAAVGRTGAPASV